MACRLSELVVDCREPEELARFWCEVLGYVRVGEEDDGAVEIGPAAGSGGATPTLLFSPSADPKSARLRVHLDLSPTDRDQDQELQRLLELGAQPADVGQLGTESWHVLADPEGNEFCLLRTRLTPL